MSSASVVKLINCSKNNLIEMVLDIEKYPSFVPWCISSEVYERINLEDRVEIKADMTVGKRILNQTYLSNVIYFKITFSNPRSLYISNIKLVTLRHSSVI